MYLAQQHYLSLRRIESLLEQLLRFLLKALPRCGTQISKNLRFGEKATAQQDIPETLSPRDV